MKINYTFHYGYKFQYIYMKTKMIIKKFLENINEDNYNYKVYYYKGKAESIIFVNHRKSSIKGYFMI